MQLAISASAFPPDGSTPDVFHRCAAAGFDQIELVAGFPGLPSIDLSEFACRALRVELQAVGLQVAGLASCESSYHDLASPDPERRRAAFIQIRAALQCAGRLSVK